MNTVLYYRTGFLGISGKITKYLMCPLTYYLCLMHLSISFPAIPTLAGQMQGHSQPQTDARAHTSNFTLYLNFIVILFIRAFIRSLLFKSA